MSSSDFERSVYATYKAAKDGRCPWYDGQYRMVTSDGETKITTLTNWARIVTAKRHHIDLKDVKRIVWEQAEIARNAEKSKQANTVSYYERRDRNFQIMQAQWKMSQRRAAKRKPS